MNNLIVTLRTADEEIERVSTSCGIRVLVKVGNPKVVWKNCVKTEF